MLGVVLCGGQSSRKGTDKGLIKLNANTWAQAAVDKMLLLKLKVVLSVNATQYNDYQSIYNTAQLIIDNDDLLVRGPLASVLSVHLQYPEEDLFVLACDMPLMETNMLPQLLLAYREHPLNGAYIFFNDGQPEPLCAIYTAKGLAFVLQLLKANELPKHSMKYVLVHIHPYAILLHEEQKKYFRNFNTHAELNGL